MRKLKLFFLFLLFLPIINAIQFHYDEARADSFAYSDDFINHDWLYSSGQVSNNTPIDSIFTTNAFAYNQDNNKPATYSRILSNNIANISTGTIMIESDVAVLQDSDRTGIPILFTIRESINDRMSFRIKPRTADNGYNLSVGISGDLPGAEPCDVKISSGYFEGNIKIAVRFGQTYTDMDDDVAHYYVWFDDVLICDSLNYSYHPESTKPRVIYYDIQQSIANGETMSIYVDNYIFGVGYFSGETVTCEYPAIFCDKFNYITPLYYKPEYRWTVFTGGSWIDEDFSPIDNELNLISGLYKKPQHTLGLFETNYPQSESQTMTSSEFAPVFSTEFELNLTNGTMEYVAYDRLGRNVLNLLINESGGTLYASSVCDDIPSHTEVTTASVDKWTDVKISIYFEPDAVYAFNSTNADNYWTVYVDGLSGEPLFTSDFCDDGADNIETLYFEKSATSNYKIDEYYVMVGLDKEIDTIDYFYDPIYTYRNLTTITSTGDLAQNIENIWATFGLKSALSKNIAALFLLFVILIGIYGLSISKGVMPHPTVIGLVMFFLMLMFSFMGLLSRWIPLLFAVMAAAFGAFFAARSFGGG